METLELGRYRQGVGSKAVTQQLSLFGSEPSVPKTKSPIVETQPIIDETGDPREVSLRRWIEFAKPQWRTILKESIEAGDKVRADYARWILETVLEDK